MSDKRVANGTSGSRPAESSDGTDVDRPFVDAVFSALADWRRREVVQYFRETDATTATVDELAFLLRGREAERIDGSSRSYEAVAERLIERDLPRLAAAGVVEFDPRSETVRYSGQPTVEKWLDHVRAIDDRGTDER